MNLIPEQLEQGRKDFEEKCKELSDFYDFELEANFLFEEHGYVSMETTAFFEVFKAACRPIPSVEEMNQIFHVMYAEELSGKPITFDLVLRSFQAIHHTLGGKE